MPTPAQIIMHADEDIPTPYKLQKVNKYEPNTRYYTAFCPTNRAFTYFDLLEHRDYITQVTIRDAVEPSYDRFVFVEIAYDPDEDDEQYEW